MSNEFVGANFTCQANVTEACVSTGEEVLQNFAIPTDPNLVWHWIVVLLAWAVVYRILAFFAFKFFQREKR